MEQNFISDPDVLTLAKEIYKGQCIIFVGAGVSLPAGLPSWSTLEKRMKKEIGLKGDYGALRTADICKQHLGENNFYDFVEKQIKTNSSPSKLHRLLAKLPSDVFITTNYDTLLEEAIKNERGNLNAQILRNSIKQKWDKVHSDGKSTWILKIHGCVENFPENVIIGEQDYLGYEKNNEHVIECLANLIKQRPILFLGYSLNDWNVNQLLHNFIIKTKGYDSNKYMVSINSDSSLKHYFEKGFNLKVINIQSEPNLIEESIINFFNQISERFEVPFWFTKTLKEFGVNPKINNIGLRTPLKLLFPGFDSTIFIRFALRLEKEYGISIPLVKLLEPNLSIEELIDLIIENNPQKTLPDILYN